MHKAQEEEEGQEIRGDELHWTNVGSAAGVIVCLLPGTENIYVPDGTMEFIIISIIIIFSALDGS
jgi:hypothetical protein